VRFTNDTGIFISGLLVCSLLLGLVLPSPTVAEENSFYPSWKLMNPKEKRQFIAGYLQGFNDARVLGEIAADYVQHNPQNAESALRDLLKHYRLTRIAPTSLISRIDDYYRDPKNHSASLRVAILKSSAKER